MTSPGPSSAVPATASPSRRWVGLGLRIAAVGLGCAMVVGLVAWFADGPVSREVHEAGIDLALRRKGTWQRAVSEVLKTPGEWYAAAAVAGLVLFLDVRRWWGGLVVVAAAAGATSNAVVKWVAGRQRPFRDGAFDPDPWTWEPFRHGAAFWTQTNLSFPSGHACHAFALATAIWLLYPRRGWIAYLAATATAVERVLSNSHYPSEVVAGGMLGAAGAYAAFAVIRARVPVPRGRADAAGARASGPEFR